MSDLRSGEWVDVTWGDVSVDMVVRRDIDTVAQVTSVQLIPTAGRSAGLVYGRIELMVLDAEGRPTGQWLTIETVWTNHVKVLV